MRETHILLLGFFGLICSTDALNIKMNVLTRNDVWANVSVASANGFTMPIISPVSNTKPNTLESRTLSDDKNFLPVMCGKYEVTPSTSLLISSPYYPAEYPENFSCTWFIKTVPEERISINCSKFSLGKGDRLDIETQETITVTKSFSEHEKLHFLVLNKNEVTISFNSDGQIQDQGFSCRIESFGVDEWENYSTKISKNKSAEKLRCGEVNRMEKRIVNGQFADPHEYPWQVYLRIFWNSGTVNGCGGSIISSKWVITAAHCVMRRGTTEIPNVTVYSRVHYLSDLSSSQVLSVKSSRVVIHPKRSFSYDLALIELSKELPVTYRVMPICLPTAEMINSLSADKVVAVAGWGNTENGTQPASLRELSQRLVDWSHCKAIYGEYITKHHFCTTTSNKGHICLGDSGGPVMSVEGSRYHLLGVISFVASPQCNLNYPDGHTSVPHFLDWIHNVTGIRTF